MIRKEKDGIQFLKFEIFEQFPKVQAAIFLRSGGISQGNFASLNLSYTVGDCSGSVTANEQRVLSLLDLKKVIAGNLSHGDIIVDAYAMIETIPKNLTFDGMVTNQLNFGLKITHADCQAACFYDPIHHAIANVHSGWKGSVQNIYEKAVDFMSQKYGTDPKMLHVGISPSLGPYDAEFIHYKQELPESFWSFQVKPNYFDFWEISRMQLMACGIPLNQIEIASISTFSNPDDYFSYRLNNITGRNATIISLL